jgi:hypothetical protein
VLQAAIAPGARIRSTLGAGVEAALRRRFEAFTTRPTGSDPGRDDHLTEMGRRLYGADWDLMAHFVGEERLVREFDNAFLEFLSGSVSERVREFALLASPVRDGQFDSLNVNMAATLRVFGIPMVRDAAERLETHLELARSTGPWWSFRDRVVISERPLIVSIDSADRPHSIDGPAIAYGDGFQVWAWHGTNVPEWVIRNPERISVASIDNEPNAEIRRVLIERFGAERLVREDAELVHDDAEGRRLWRRQSGPRQRFGGGAQWRRARLEEPIVMVEVLNSTPEPDGSRKTYFLRVPPNMETTTEAVAWTFGMDGAEYAPAVES